MITGAERSRSLIALTTASLFRTYWESPDSAQPGSGDPTPRQSERMPTGADSFLVTSSESSSRTISGFCGATTNWVWPKALTFAATSCRIDAPLMPWSRNWLYPENSKTLSRSSPS